MSTTEKLFVQIFERKRQFIDRVKHQTLLFDQQLASKCIIDGIAPPPWLLSSAFPSATNELNKEELISGLLLQCPPPAIPYSSSYCSLYHKPVIAAENADLPDGFYTEVRTSNKGFDSGDRLSISPQFPINEAGGVSNGVQKQVITADNVDFPDGFYTGACTSNKGFDGGDRLSISPQFPINDAGGASNGIQKPFNTADSMDMPDVFYTEVRASNTGFDAGDRLSISPQLPTNDAGGVSNGVQGPDTDTATSPEDHRDTRISEVCTSNKGFDGGNRLSISPQLSINDAEGASNGTATSPEDHRDARISEVCTSNKGFDGGNRLPISPQLPINDAEGASNGTATSPEVHRDARMSEVCTSNKGFDGRNRLSISPQLPINDAEGASNGVQKPFITADGADLLDGFYTEVHASNKCFDARDRLSFSPQLPINGARGVSNGVQDPNSGAATFPEDHRDARMSKVSPDTAQSLGNIQRSKSRQRALELRNSAKTVKSHLRDENYTGVVASGITGPEIASLQFDPVHELELVASLDIDKENCEVEEAKDVDLQNKEKVSSKEDKLSGPLFPDPRPATSHSSNDSVTNKKPAVTSDCEESPDSSYMRVHDLIKGFVAEDEASVLPQFPVNDTGCNSNGALDLDAGTTSPQDQRNASISDIDPEPFQSLVRVQRSKSRQRALELRDAKEAKSRLGTGSVIAMQQSDDVDESELAKPVYVYDESCAVEEGNVYDFQSKEKGSNIYSGRSITSQSSGQQPSSMRETSHVGTPNYIGRSSRDDNNVGCSKSTEHQIEENYICLKQSFGSEVVGSWPQLKRRKVGGKLRDTVSSSPNIMEDAVVQLNVSRSPVNKVEPVVQHLTGECELSTVRVSSLLPEHVHELEMVKPVDICYEGGVVDEAEVVDFQTKEGSVVSSGRITRSQSSSQQASSARESLNVRNSCSIEDKNVGTSKSRQQISENSILSARCLQTGGEGSWPQRKKRKIEGQLTDTIYASPNLRVDDVTQFNVNKSPADTMDHVELNLTGGSESAPVEISSLQPEYAHELDLVKPDGIRYESCVVEESKIGDFQSMEKGCNLYSGRTTRSRSSNSQASSVRESLNVSKLNYMTPLSVSPSLKAELDRNEGSQMIEESQSSPGLQVDEGEQSLEKRVKCSYTPFTFMQEESEVPLFSSLVNQIAEVSQGCSNVDAEVADPTSIIYDSRKQCIMGEGDILLHLDHKFGPGDTEHLTSKERGTQERNSHLDENGNFSPGSVGSPRRHSMDLIGADQAMPDLEGFFIKADNKQSCISGERMSFDDLDLPKSSIEPTSVLERLHKSAFMHTPLPQFSTMHKLHRAPDMYQSVPNGLLECMDSRSDHSVDDYIGKQIKPSYSFFSEEVNHALQGRSYSDCLPFSSTQSAWDIKKPYASPVGKLRDRITTTSGSSEKRSSLNPELPCICEENEDTYEVADVFQEGICSEVVPSSVQREPLAKVTENPNLPQSFSKAEISSARNSIESVNTEYSFSGTSNRVKQKLGHHNSRKKGHTTKAKMSHGTSLGESSIDRVTGSVRNRFSKPKLSGKASLRKGGLSFLERESKRNNIVSNVTSFVPLVQQKQEAAIITGKRDVKVKALEAAEAAKHLAQEKENARKMKKEALKLERARLEQENLKQLELERKKKEEERKKKEAEMAARKRQREEEEKKEKERKRKRVMDARKQQRENEEKLRPKKEKEVKCRAMDEPVSEMKASNDEIGKFNKKEKVMGDESRGKLFKPNATVVSTSDNMKASIVPEVCEPLTDCANNNSKVMSNLHKATEIDNFGTNRIQEQSYDISPYKGSDDEDEDEDDLRNSKFVPSWASKKSVAMAISSLQGVDPKVIFPPKRSCSIDEVLLPRRQQK